MKNHWLNKNKTLSVEDVRHARELEAQGVEGVCEFNEMAVELTLEAKALDMGGEITIGAGWSSNDIKIEDITWDNTLAAFDCGGQSLCISGNPYPLEVDPAIAISSITISNDWADFESDQTALSELDMELSDGSIKYVREINVGNFTFKDAGTLGIDIFVGSNKIGWLNSNGESTLKEWLNNKAAPINPCRNDPFSASAMHSHLTKESIQGVSNEVPDNLYGGVHKHNTYQLENGNIIPGSVILTAHVNGVALQSENLCINGAFTEGYNGISHTYACERSAISKVKLDHKTGVITVSWINSNVDDVRSLSFCYEYICKLHIS